MLIKNYYLSDESQTVALGAALAEILTPGLIVYLQGNLGAGKTTLVRAILSAMGHKGRVKSPTYTLAETYGVTHKGKEFECIHFDLYRMSCAHEFLEAGFRDYFNNNNLCLVEWAEKAEKLLPNADIHVFVSVKDDGREVELRANTEKGELCLARLTAFAT